MHKKTINLKITIFGLYFILLFIVLINYIIRRYVFKHFNNTYLFFIYNVIFNAIGMHLYVKSRTVVNLL
jgi:hypothetical protein